MKGISFQIFLLTPIFWFNELLQNFLYNLLSGHWGWIYPASPYYWFTFTTLINWLVGVSIIFFLYQEIFMPRKLSFSFRIGSISILGFLGEYLSNFLITYFSGKVFIVWLNSPLIYIGWLALPLWCWDAFLFEWFYRKISIAGKTIK